MSDYFFTSFYNQVKDKSWPQIANYNDFLKLPGTIQEECFQVHHLRDRLDELEDEQYWMSKTWHNIGYQCRDVVYVPVMKCANSYYVDLIHVQNGWKQVKLLELDLDKVHLFGLLLHPLTRRIKGVTEVLGISHQHDYKKVLLLLKQPEFAVFVSHISTLDAHTMPYAFLFGSLLEKITWIPMDVYTDVELQQQIKNFVETHGVSIKFPNKVSRINQSDTYKTQCFDELQKIYMQAGSSADFCHMFGKDIALYHRLIESVQSQH